MVSFCCVLFITLEEGQLCCVLFITLEEGRFLLCIIDNCRGGSVFVVYY